MGAPVLMTPVTPEIFSLCIDFYFPVLVMGHEVKGTLSNRTQMAKINKKNKITRLISPLFYRQ